MPAKKKNSKLPGNTSSPFILHLGDEPYILTEEGLKSQVDATFQKKRNWFYPTINFISLNNQVLKLRISNRELSYELTVKIDPQKLHISCSCGSSVQTLCYHAYQTLERLILFQGTDYFKRYAPKGLFEIALVNKRHFTIKPNDTGLNIEPVAGLGSVYKIADKMDGFNFHEVLNLPYKVVEQESLRVTDLTYVILYSSRNKYFPFLLPCLGILNKAGTNIKGFYNFITDASHEYDGLTVEQKQLNGLCHEMFSAIKTENGSLIPPDTDQTSAALSIFNLWNKALPILHQQPFIYRYNYYYRLELKDKPQKGRLQRIRVSTQKPQLSFKLIDKGAFYQLEMNVAVQGKIHKQFDTISTFFICKDQCLYLLSSVKDIGILEWMRRCGNRITVFKEHFAEFKTAYLDPLSNHYWLEMAYPQK
jgi:hypothetical protein